MPCLPLVIVSQPKLELISNNINIEQFAYYSDSSDYGKMNQKRCGVFHAQGLGVRFGAKKGTVIYDPTCLIITSICFLVLISSSFPAFDSFLTLLSTPSAKLLLPNFF